MRREYRKECGHLHVILLEGGWALKGSKDLIKKGKSTLCPDDEAAKMTTRGELEEIESLDAGKFDTGEVAECLYDAVIFAVDDERATALAVATVAHLSLSGAESARVCDLDDIGVSVDALQEGDCFLGLVEGFDGGGDDERNLGDLLDAVATGEDERGEGRSSEGGDGSETTLVLVDFDVPLAPSFCRGEHATTPAHVAKGSLGGWSGGRGGRGDGSTWPERCVPPPPTRGIRATARPVPQDSAEVWWPAFSLTA